MSIVTPRRSISLLERMVFAEFQSNTSCIMISFSKHNSFKFVLICYHVIVLHPFNGITSVNLWTIHKILDSLCNSNNILVVCKIVQVRPSKKNMSFMNMLNNIGIDPCGMSDRINFKRLKLFLILTHCLRPLR